MVEEKKCLPEIKAYFPDDLSKRWFLYYYRDGDRMRVYGDINRYHTIAERKEAMRKLKRKLKIELAVPVVTIRDKCYQYVEDNRPIWRKKTYQTIKSKLNVLFGRCSRELDKLEVEQFFKWLKHNKHSTTYSNYLSKLRTVLKAIGEEHRIEDIPHLKEHRRPARYFQPHQIARLKKYISSKDPQLWLFVQFIYYCFIRPGELRHFKASDVLLSEESLIVKSSISKNHKTEYVAIPKPFFPHLKYVNTLKPNEYLFPSYKDHSKPIGLNTMSTRHRKILKELGFGVEYKLYSWKHTGAVMAAKSGVGVKELQLQLRHHSLDQVNEYLRQMGVSDLDNLKNKFPKL